MDRYRPENDINDFAEVPWLDVVRDSINDVITPAETWFGKGLLKAKLSAKDHQVNQHGNKIKPLDGEKLYIRQRN